MNAGELRDMQPDELERKLLDLKEEFFNLRFQQEIGQLENTTKLGSAKKEIARVKTILKEKKLTGTAV